MAEAGRALKETSLKAGAASLAGTLRFMADCVLDPKSLKGIVEAGSHPTIRFHPSVIAQVDATGSVLNVMSLISKSALLLKMNTRLISGAEPGRLNKPKKAGSGQCAYVAHALLPGPVSGSSPSIAAAKS